MGNFCSWPCSTADAIKGFELFAALSNSAITCTRNKRRRRRRRRKRRDKETKTYQIIRSEGDHGKRIMSQRKVFLRMQARFSHFLFHTHQLAPQVHVTALAAPVAVATVLHAERRHGMLLHATYSVRPELRSVFSGRHRVQPLLQSGVREGSMNKCDEWHVPYLLHEKRQPRPQFSVTAPCTSHRGRCSARAASGPCGHPRLTQVPAKQTRAKPTEALEETARNPFFM